MNELSLNKSLSRFALIAIALLSIVVLLLLLRYVLVQLFVALIIAAGMSPLVSAVGRRPRAMSRILRRGRLVYRLPSATEDFRERNSVRPVVVLASQMA